MKQQIRTQSAVTCLIECFGMETRNFGGTEEYLKMTDGFNLFCRHWPSTGKSERIVIFLHGIEVHSGAFRFMGPGWQMLTAKFTLSIEEALEFERAQSAHGKCP